MLVGCQPDWGPALIWKKAKGTPRPLASHTCLSLFSLPRLQFLEASDMYHTVRPLYLSVASPGQTAHCDASLSPPTPPQLLEWELSRREEGLEQDWSFLAQNQLDTQRPLVTESVKRAAISMARDSWEIYFSRLFPAMVGVPEHPFPPARSSQGE
jgi:hypothetical protein